jgi:phosphoglycolate phosphatase
MEILDLLGLSGFFGAVTGGDSLPVRKPDPAPVLRACELAGVEAFAAAFVGDDLRAIEAGRAAGTSTVAAAWGYLDGGDPSAWGADHVVAVPSDLPRTLGLW